jgi:hypothetical protein
LPENRFSSGNVPFQREAGCTVSGNHQLAVIYEEAVHEEGSNRNDGGVYGRHGSGAGGRGAGNGRRR